MSGYDGAGIGIADFATTTVNSIPVDDGGYVYTHSFWIEIPNGQASIRTAANTTQQIVGTPSASASWKIEYTGADRTNMTMTVYRNETLIMTQTGVLLPATGRLALIGRSGGFSGSAVFNNITYTLLPG
jgi:hypothetical protein